MSPKKKTSKDSTKPENLISGTLEKDEIPYVEPTPEELKDMTVSGYFDYVKGMKQKTDSENVKKMADVCENLLKKFNILGQVSAAAKAKNAFDVLQKEAELYDKGIDTFVFIDDVTKYLKNVADHSVKIIEIENFPREIPDDVADKWLSVKDMFDAGYIVFTDYTETTEETNTVAAASGKTSTTKEAAKRKKDKDPILFGAIKVDGKVNGMRRNTYEKLFFIADWIDEYCDLTFDKLIKKMADESETGKAPVFKTELVTTKEQFKERSGL